MTSTRSSGSDKTLTSEPINHDLDSQFHGAYWNGDDKISHPRSSVLSHRPAVHSLNSVENSMAHLDPTTLAQRVLSETVRERYALEVMQGESLRSLKQKQVMREMEEVNSLQSDVTSHVNETPPPLPSEPPPQMDEPDCSIPTSTSSHFTLPPNPASCLPYSVNSSNKPVASVLPSVYSSSRSFAQTNDKGKYHTKLYPMRDDHQNGKPELKPKPPLPLKAKTVTFSDDVRNDASNIGENSPATDDDTANNENNNCKNNEIVKNSVKKLTSKFEQQSISATNNNRTTKATTKTDSPVERNSSASHFMTPRGYQPPPPYPGHKVGQEPRQCNGMHLSTAETDKKVQSGHQHVSQSSLCSDRSTISTISESSSVLPDQQPPGEMGFDASKNWYDSDSESLPSLPPISSDSHVTSRYGRSDDHNKSFDSTLSEPTLSVPVFAQADKIRSIYQNQNGYTSSTFHSRDTVEVVTAPDLPGYSQESGFFNDNGDPSFSAPPEPPANLHQSQSRRPITCYDSEHVYQNLPGSEDSPRQNDSGFSDRQPPPPPIRSVSKHLSHFTSQPNGRPVPEPQYNVSPHLNRVLFASSNGDSGDCMRNNVPVENTVSRLTNGAIPGWKPAPPPYHSAINRTNGPAGSHIPTPQNQNRSKRSAFSSTLHVSKC